MLSFLDGPTLTSIHDYWKNIALTRWTFAGKIMSLLFNMLSRFFIAFLPRSKCLLISWLQSPSAVILEPKKRKSVTVSGSGLFSLPAKKLAIFSRVSAPFYIPPSSSVVKNPPAMEETPFDPWVRKIPWRRDRLPAPVFLPGESHGLRNLAGYSPRVATSRTRLSD